MRVVLESLKGSADILIFDSPPIQAFTDSAILSSFLDGTLLVIDAGHSRRGSVRQGREALAKAGANVLGVVLNRVPARGRADLAQYYGDYHMPDEKSGSRTRGPEESPERSAT
jgi:Mrp family chromosome partitioning ATPase